MGRKIKLRTVQYFIFYCPACKCEHTVSDVSGWNVTGTIDCPTITPSVLNQYPIQNEETGVYELKNRCHLFVTNGIINYCSDCDHEFAGQKIEMVDLKS